MIKKILKSELIFIVTFILLICVLGIFYLFNNVEYQLIPKRFETIVNYEFINYFEYFINERLEVLKGIIDGSNEIKNEIVNGINNSINSEMSFKDRFYIFSHWYLDFLYNAMFYGLNIGLNILLILYILYEIYITSDNKSIKYTILAKTYIKSLDFTKKIIVFLKGYFKKSILIIKKYKLIFISIFIVLFHPLVLRVALEIFIGIISYIKALIELDCYNFWFNVLKFLLILLVPLFWKLPIFFKTLILVIGYILLALKKSSKKLKKNYEQVKCFARFDTAQTNLFNGAPGMGKTRLITYLGLASEENFIEDLEEMLHDVEMKNYKYNYASLDYRIINDKLTEQDYVENLEYIQIYSFLYFRNSFIMSNYAIKDIYYDCFSKILKNSDLEFNVKYDDCLYGLEKYCVMCISELDKYTNSHDKTKEYYTNGVNAFFSMISHVLDRLVKVYVDYQLKDQVPLMIRGNAEKQYRIVDSSNKLPLLLEPIYFVVNIFYMFFNKITLKYSYKKNKLYYRSNRYDKRFRKRFDYSFLFSFCLSVTNSISILIDYLNTYSYTKMKLVEMVNDGEIVGKIKLNLNEIDSNYQGERLYNSVCFKSIYKSKKNCEFKELDEWESLDSTEEELKKCGMFDKVL